MKWYSPLMNTPDNGAKILIITDGEQPLPATFTGDYVYNGSRISEQSIMFWAYA